MQDKIIKELKINQKIDIEFPQSINFKKRYPSRIEDKTEEGITIAMPMEKGNLIPVTERQRILIWYWDSSAVYALFCRIKKIKIQPVPLVLLDFPENIKKVQRRDFVRVPANLKIEYVLENEESFKEANLKDISGGGLQFSTTEKLIKGHNLKLQIHLPEEIIECRGQVAWTKENLSPDMRIFYIGVRFYKLDRYSQEKIIKFVFSRQRELISKGVLW